MKYIVTVRQYSRPSTRSPSGQVYSSATKLTVAKVVVAFVLHINRAFDILYLRNEEVFHPVIFPNSPGRCLTKCGKYLSNPMRFYVTSLLSAGRRSS